MRQPRAIVCCICGGKYFKQSLPHHQKVCANRHNVPIAPCIYCGILVPKPDEPAHHRDRCDKAPRPVAETPAEFPPQNAEDDAGLVPCAYCGRRFYRHRIETHEGICAKTASRVPRRAAKQTEHLTPRTEHAAPAREPPTLLHREEPLAKSVAEQPVRKVKEMRQPEKKVSPRPRAKETAIRDTRSGGRAQKRQLNPNFGKDATLMTGGPLPDCVNPAGRRGTDSRGNQKMNVIHSNVTSADNPLLGG